MSRAEYFMIGAVRGGQVNFEKLAAMLPTEDYETIASRYVHAAGSSTESRDDNYPGTCQDAQKVFSLLYEAAENQQKKIYLVEPFRIPLQKGGFIEFRKTIEWGEYTWNGNNGHWTVEARRVEESSLDVWSRAAVKLFEDMKTNEFVILRDYDSESKMEKEEEYTPLFHIKKRDLTGSDKFTTLRELAPWGFRVRIDPFRKIFGPDWQRLSLGDLGCLTAIK